MLQLMKPKPWCCSAVGTHETIYDTISWTEADLHEWKAALIQQAHFSQIKGKGTFNSLERMRTAILL